MNFFYPIFLFGFFAILIPLIIHLFNFRTYKTIYFSNVQYLKNIKKETKSKSNLKHILVLISRTLAISSLVLAFAQPYIPTENNQKAIHNQIGIYIDNSFSTEADSKYGKISEVAKKKALQIIDAYSENTQFIFLNNEFEQKHQHFVTKEQIKEFIGNTKTSPVVVLISDVINKFSGFFNEHNSEKIHKRTYLISDFQKTSSNLNELKNDTLMDIVFVPLESENSNNIFIDSLWFNSPYRPIGQTDEINIKITNTSEDSYQEMPVNLLLNDTLKATGTYNIEAKESIIKTIKFTNHATGTIFGTIEITDFPVSFDNTFYFNYEIAKKLNILILSNKSSNKYIEDVFTNKSDVKIIYKSTQNDDYQNLNDFNLIILDEIDELTEKLNKAVYSYISDGGTLIMFPGIKLNVQSYNTFFNKLGMNYITGIDTSKTYAEKINYNADVFKNVFKKKEKNLDLPYILNRVKFSNQTYSNEEVILSSEKNDKLISSSNYNSGRIYIFSQTADQKSGNLVFHPIWVPLIYNMAYFHNNNQQLYYTIGENHAVKYKVKNLQTEKPVHITNYLKTIDIIPQISTIEGLNKKFFLNTSIQTAGHYYIENETEIIQGLSLNYDRSESDLNLFSYEEIHTIIEENSLKNFTLIKQNKENYSEIIQEQNIGKQLWKLFIILALLFLLIEIVIIRLLFVKR